MVYIHGGQRPPGVRAKIKCKPNPSLTGVLVYISGGQRPPGVRAKIKCKPNLSLSGVWFTFTAGSARHELYCQRVVAFPEYEATILRIRPGFWLLFCPRPLTSPLGVRIKTECKPNLSLSGVWFTFQPGNARRGLNHDSNVNQILLWPGFWLLFPPRPA